MDAITTWYKILKHIGDTGLEIHTIPKNVRNPKWFFVSTRNNSIMVQNARTNSPSVELSSARNISFRDFETVHDYYDSWKKGAIGVRHEVSRKSRNTAYIFALIDMVI